MHTSESRRPARSIGRALAAALVLVLAVALSWLAAVGPAGGAGRPTPTRAAEPTAAPAPRSDACAPPSRAAPADWPVVLCDTFDDDADGWWPAGVKSDAMLTHKRAVDGRYRWDMVVHQPALTGLKAHLDPVRNFYLAVDARRVSGSEADVQYGLQFRLRDADNCYFFWLADGRGFALTAFIQGDWRILIEWTPTAALRPGDWNRLAVKAVGPDLTLYVNDEQVAEFTDDSIPEGQVGLKVQVASVGAAALEFDNLEVRVAPPGAPTAARPTPRATATPAPRPTDTPLPPPAATSTPSAPSIAELPIGDCAPKSKTAPSAWPSIICDTFDTNAAGWRQTTAKYEGGTADSRITGGAYTWSLAVTTGMYYGCMLDIPILADFYAAEDVRIMAVPGVDPWCGVEFRAVMMDSYYFLLSNEQGFSLMRYLGGKMDKIVPWTTTPLIRPNDWNRLAVMAVGPNLTLFINDQPVAQVSDDALLSGQVGPVTMAQSPGRAFVDFDNFEVRRAPADVRLTPVATLAATPTPVSSAGVCAPSPPSAPADWPVVLCDTFDDNHNKWRVGTRRDDLVDGARTIQGTYALKFNAREAFWWSEEPVAVEAADFYLTIEGQRQSKLGSAGYGLMYRGVSFGSFFAILVYDKVQKFKVVIAMDGSLREIVPLRYSAAIKSGKANRIAVKAVGRHFIAYLNDQPVAEWDDIHYKRGQIGVFLQLARGDEGTVEFDNLELRAPKGK